MTRVYKILARAEWEEARRLGRYDGSAVDRRDGFIHLSTAAQAPETARRHFAGQDGLVVAEFAAENLEGLRWELSRGGERFPHVYGPLDPALALRVEAADLGPDGNPDLAFLS